MKQNAKMANAFESVDMAQQGKNGVVETSNNTINNKNFTIMNKNYENANVVSVAGTEAQENKNGVAIMSEGKDYFYLRKISSHKLDNQIERYEVFNMTSEQIGKRNANPTAHEFCEFKDADGHLIKEVFTFGKYGDHVHRYLLMDMIWQAIISYTTEYVNEKSDALQNIARLYPLYQSLKLDREGVVEIYPEDFCEIDELPLVSEYLKLSEADKKGLLQAAREKEKSMYPFHDEEQVRICGEKFSAKFLGEIIRTGCIGKASKSLPSSAILTLYKLVFNVYLSYIIQGASQAVSIRNTVRYFKHLGNNISKDYVVNALNCLYFQDLV